MMVFLASGSGANSEGWAWAAFRENLAWQSGRFRLSLRPRLCCHLREEWRTSMLGARNHIWLGVSGLTTALSWIFSYRAMKDGEVSTVAPDRQNQLHCCGSACLARSEQITPRVVLGCLLIGSGLFVAAYRPAT
jgi:drug/metabolite transporter (DMT)-like permease